mmetsp:Transcript_22572/g.45095  ORF Transcript_22572/g.45095 Transcript_22572/m.45095 type:complete len:391 (-) Transcript_22572:20-1192(-)
MRLMVMLLMPLSSRGFRSLPSLLSTAYNSPRFFSSTSSSPTPSNSSLPTTPFATTYHAPVMCNRILSYLEPMLSAASPPKRVVDLTCGGGGHTEAFLQLLKEKGATDVEVIGVDRDRDSALEAGKRLKSFPNFRHVLSNFGDLTVEQLGGQVDFVLADFGVSSHQIDDTSRGFRYGGADGDNAGPLDMRMGRDEGPSAADVVNEGSEEELVEILMKYGGEGYMSAKRIVASIIDSRPLTRTDELAAAVEAVTPKWNKGSPRKGALKTKARVFQAIRVAVNDEMGSLDRLFTTVLPRVVRPGGLCAVLTYQSDEDTVAKRAFRSHRVVAGRVVEVKDAEIGRDLYGNEVAPGERVWDVINNGEKAKADETKANSRARSARLRVARRRENYK